MVRHLLRHTRPEVIMIKTSSEEPTMIIRATTKQSIAEGSSDMELTAEVDCETHVDTTC
jgi:hypothetical protein